MVMKFSVIITLTFIIANVANFLCFKGIAVGLQLLTSYFEKLKMKVNGGSPY